MSFGCASLLQGEIGVMMMAIMAVAALVMVCRQKAAHNDHFTE